MSDINDIWSNADGLLSEEKLEAYLAGKLSEEEVREVELYLSDEGMESDAVDGLADMSSQEVQELTQKINHKLQYELRKEKYRHKKHYKDNKWGLIAVLIIIVLCILGYYILQLII
ncbi:MAG: hypothetical protein R2800_07010 [Flavipsychrobacter sp.]